MSPPNKNNAPKDAEVYELQHRVKFPIVGIGASAGGFNAFKTFFRIVPADTGMAFVLIQHLDPTHESLTADLLARFTAMEVIKVEDQMAVEANHIYVIPPNKYLTVHRNALHLSKPILDRGMRMPIDSFFRSLAEEQHEKAICIILSGTGSDGTLGLKAIKGHGGMAMAQDPEVAQYDGMPRSAIATGLVDYICPVEQMPEALIKYVRHFYFNGAVRTEAQEERTTDHLRSILSILRTRTKYDFRSYKRGTLIRRISRRMGLSHIDKMEDYVSLLRDHPEEISRLFKDLLIGVTGFFREPQAYEVLEKQVLSKLVRAKSTDNAIRVWVPGCSTGEEPYSIAIVLTEQLLLEQKHCPLQIFATDIDEGALDSARNGIYPENIAVDVSPAHLRRFFNKHGQTLEVNRQIRESVVFAVQNLISDPPFSKLDLISCRNLLIYLEQDIQKKLISLFHFALNEGGYLFLGSAETVGQRDELFESISKKWRVYRRIGPTRPYEVHFPIVARGKKIGMPLTTPQPLLSDPVLLGELTHEQLLQNYAPASVLINHRHQILYNYGPTDRYLKRPDGAPTDDLLLQTRQGLTTKLRVALHQAVRADQPVTVSGVQIQHEHAYHTVQVTVHPIKVPKADARLLLVSFEEASEPASEKEVNSEASASNASLVQHLEVELKATRQELQSTIEEQESANEELKAANEEVMSVNEELQSTNEELETSKEELQSLNEELSTVNNQLQEKVGELEGTNNDLNNLLGSTDIATLFLDARLRIRRFTPTTTRLLNLITTDVGRPFSDITGMLQDPDLVSDAELVLDKLMPSIKEVRTGDNHYYIRRMVPYRTQDNRIDGVVITFADITERKRAEEVIVKSKKVAVQANRHKSRFLAAASHDLRQPLQTLSILNGIMLEKSKDLEFEEYLKIGRETLRSMAELLEAFLNISKLEAGVITPQITDFEVNNLLGHIKGEFENQAKKKRLTLRIVPCSVTIRSDHSLLDRIVQNLVSNAVKHTEAGKVLIGCRHRGRNLRIEVWDTGMGIPKDQLKLIFEEFFQLGNPARDQQKGLGLGLSIVDRMARLLGHPLDVQSTPGKGSMFAVQVPLGEKTRASKIKSVEKEASVNTQSLENTTVLIIEDNPAVLQASNWLMESHGARVINARTGKDALKVVEGLDSPPDVIIVDYRLPESETGIQALNQVRNAVGCEIPAIILTGDTTVEVYRDAERSNCQVLHKPIEIDQLIELMRRLLKDSGSREAYDSQKHPQNE